MEEEKVPHEPNRQYTIKSDDVLKERVIPNRGNRNMSVQDNMISKKLLMEKPKNKDKRF